MLYFLLGVAFWGQVSCESPASVPVPSDTVPSVAISVENQPASSSSNNSPDVQSLEADVLRLFETIKRDSPGLYYQLQSRSRADALQQIFDSLQTGVRLTPNTDTDSSLDRKTEIFSGRLLEDKRVLYLRMDVLSTDSVRSLEEEIIQSQNSKPLASVLDLRNAFGRTPQEYDLVARILPYFLPSPEKKDASAWYQTCPLAILISKKTTGAPAYLAALLSSRRVEVVTMGCQSPETPFPVKRERTAGFTWNVPVIPENALDRISASSLTPDIVISGNSSQIEFKKLSSYQAISADKTLRSALDFVLSLSMIRK